MCTASTGLGCKSVLPLLGRFYAGIHNIQSVVRPAFTLKGFREELAGYEEGRDKLKDADEFVR